MKERRYTLYLQWKTFILSVKAIHPCDSFFFCSQIILVSLAWSKLEYYTPPERGASSSQGYPLVLFCHYPFTHWLEREGQCGVKFLVWGSNTMAGSGGLWRYCSAQVHTFHKNPGYILECGVWFKNFFFLFSNFSITIQPMYSTFIILRKKTTHYFFYMTCLQYLQLCSCSSITLRYLQRNTYNKTSLKHFYST